MVCSKDWVVEVLQPPGSEAITTTSLASCSSGISCCQISTKGGGLYAFLAAKAVRCDFWKWSCWLGKLHSASGLQHLTTKCALGHCPLSYLPVAAQRAAWIGSLASWQLCPSLALGFRLLPCHVGAGPNADRGKAHQRPCAWPGTAEGGVLWRYYHFGLVQLARCWFTIVQTFPFSLFSPCWWFWGVGGASPEQITHFCCTCFGSLKLSIDLAYHS